MMRATIVLADFAETDPGGKVHALGVGWSVTGPQPAPQAVIGYIQVPAEEASEPISFILRLLDKSGEVVEVPGPAGMQPMEAIGQVEVRTPEGWDEATELSAAFVVNVMLPLATGQRYAWTLEIAGKEVASTAFFVRSSPPSADTD